ncbi:hypothetical protein LJC21_04800 [Bacteroides sp. OttesenSCG-928-E20]|nr:hypothetical protein [Bacteroides sp. OttesenSCG-928-E20]
MKKQLLFILLFVVSLGAYAGEIVNEPGKIAVPASILPSVKKVSYTFSIESLGDGLGGGFIINSDVGGWDSLEFGISGTGGDAGKPFMPEYDGANTITITREIDGSAYGAATYFECIIQHWWGTILTFVQFKAYDADGKVVFAQPEIQEELGEGVEIPFDQYGNVLLKDFVNYDDDSVVKLVLNVKSNGETQVGWGVGKIIPINCHSVELPDSEIMALNCIAISDEGELNEYTLTIADLKELAKIDGEYYTDEYGQQGITINTWGGATRVSLTVYVSKTEEVEEIDLPFDQYGNVLLKDFECYSDDSEVKLVLNVKTSGSTAVGWGIAKIVPIGFYEAPDAEILMLNCKAISDEGELNEYTLTIADLKELAKIDGEYYKDEYDQQGITINTWGETTRVSLKVYSKGGSTGIEDTVFTPKKSPIVSFPGGIEVDNDGAKVTVYGIDGRQVLQTTDNRIYLEKGIYIVQIGNSVHKTVVR